MLKSYDELARQRRLEEEMEKTKAREKTKEAIFFLGKIVTVALLCALFKLKFFQTVLIYTVVGLVFNFFRSFCKNVPKTVI